MNLQTASATSRSFFLIIVLTFWGGIFSGAAQEKEKDLGTQEVNVVRSFTPTLSNVQKILKDPILADSISALRKPVSYTIMSVPVASTFTPAKGKPTVLQKEPTEPIYQNLVRIGVGNFSTGTAEVYSNTPLNRDAGVELTLDHHSSQGGIDGVVLDDKFFDTALEGGYRYQDRYMSWNAKGGFSHQLYNWYGLQEGILESILLPEGSEINESRSLFSVFLGGGAHFDGSFIEGANLELRHSWDSRSSVENRMWAKPEFVLPDSDINLRIHTVVDYLNGSFRDNNYTPDDISYSSLIAGAAPEISFVEGDLAVRLGGKILFNHDGENGDNDLYIYPNVEASYALSDGLIPYAGVSGDLRQNTYFDLMQTNPYLIPELDIRPSDELYKAFAGFKGQVTQQLSYDASVMYGVTNDGILIQNAGINTLQPELDYSLGNGFQILYDKITTISVGGSLQWLLPQGLQTRVSARVFDYDTETEEEAWNLPVATGELSLDLPLGKKLTLGSSLFFTGTRKDLLDNGGIRDVVTLDSFLDINARASYRISSEWGAFLQLNNLTNNEYARWANYRVQGFQILAGLSYQFDL